MPRCRQQQQPNQLPTQPSGTDLDNPDCRQQQQPNRRHRPHSSDTDLDNSDFEPNSNVTETTANQQNELDRCNSLISNLDEDAEMQKIINQQAQMFVISERELE